MKKFILVVTSTIALNGCALLFDASDRTAKSLGKGISYYCENVVPYVSAAERQAFIDKINARAAPHSTAPLNCAGSSTP